MAIRRLHAKSLLLLVLLAAVSFYSLSYFFSTNGTGLSHNADPPRPRDANGNLKAPELATGVANVIDMHRAASQPELTFPDLIHQTSKRNDPTPAVASWYYANPKSEHLHYTDSEVLKFVQTHYPHALDAFQSLKSPVARADLFRYYVLHQLGGVYTDIDTTALCPIHGWIPEDFSERDIALVIGIEVDEPSFSKSKVAKWGWALPFQFVQWTIMARPGHVVLERTADEAIQRLRALATERNKPLDQLELDKLDLVRSTGPGVFTSVVLDYLGIEASELHRLETARQIKDVLILPVTAFAPNQRHSGSRSVSKWESVMEVRVMHGFQNTRHRW